MPRETFVWRTRLPFSAERVFDWHMRPDSFERLCPPWEEIDVIRRDEPLAEGSRVEMRVRTGPIRRRWIAEHRGFVPGRQFRDIQISGPFQEWQHTHLMEPDGPD